MVMVFPGRLASRAGDFGSGSGFAVTFDASESQAQLRRIADARYGEVVGASVEAVNLTTNELKQRLRAYIDAHFSGSAFTGGAGGRKSHRRVAFAAAQSKTYDEVEQKGQYTGLIYSKFGRGRGPGGFVDYLLLHVRGGAIRPNGGEWLRINNKAAGGAAIGAQVGHYGISDSNVFWRKSKDGSRLFLLRSFGSKGQHAKSRGKIQLLATLLKLVNIKPDLAGVDAIAAERPTVFLGHFDAALARQQGTA